MGLDPINLVIQRHSYFSAYAEVFTRKLTATLRGCFSNVPKRKTKQTTLFRPQCQIMSLCSSSIRMQRISPN